MHDMVGILLQLCIAYSGDADNNGIACLDFLDVGERLFVNISLRSKRDHRNPLNDQCKRAVL